MKKTKQLVAILALFAVVAMGVVSFVLKGDDLLGYMGLSSKMKHVDVANAIGIRRAEVFHDDVSKHNETCDISLVGYDGYCYLLGERIIDGKGLDSTDFLERINRGDAALTFQKGLNLEVLTDAGYKDSLYPDIWNGELYYIPTYTLGYLGIPSVKPGSNFYPSGAMTPLRFNYWIKNLDTVLSSSVTRGEMVMYAVVASSLPVLDQNFLSEKKPSFVDVPQTHKYYEYIETALADGLISNNSTGYYNPDQPIIRSEAVKMIASAFDLAPLNAERPTFADVPLNSWASVYVETLVSRGIIKSADSRFYPSEEASHKNLIEWLSTVKYGS